MRRLLALALGLCLFASPAFAAITLVAGSAGSITFIGSTSGSVTPTANIPAGSLLIAITEADNTGTNTFSNCHDNTANTWTAGPIGSNNGAAAQIWYSYTANLVSTAGSVTCTNSIAGFLIQSIAFSGTSTTPFDSASPAGANNSGSSQTVGPSGTLACPGGGAACEVCITGVMWHSTGTVTDPGAPWTTLTGGGAGIDWSNGYQIASATTALSYTATTTASANSAGAMACFQGPAVGGSSSYGGGTTVGVGH